MAAKKKKEETKKEEVKTWSLKDSVATELKKRYPSNGMPLKAMDEYPNTLVEEYYLSTGILQLDFVSGGGFKIGQASKLAGKEGVCKSRIMKNVAAYVTSFLKQEVWLIENESMAWTREDNINAGINNSLFRLLPAGSLEEALNWIITTMEMTLDALKKGKLKQSDPEFPALILLDSFASGPYEDEKEKPIGEKEKKMERASVMAQFCRLYLGAANDFWKNGFFKPPTFIYANQHRNAPPPMPGMPTKVFTPGGIAQDNTVRFIADLVRTGSVSHKEVKIGRTVQATVSKPTLGITEYTFLSKSPAPNKIRNNDFFHGLHFIQFLGFPRNASTGHWTLPNPDNPDKPFTPHGDMQAGILATDFDYYTRVLKPLIKAKFAASKVPFVYKHPMEFEGYSESLSVVVNPLEEKEEEIKNLVEVEI